MPVPDAGTSEVGPSATPSYDAARQSKYDRKGSRVTYCHQHNLVEPDQANADRKFGIKVSLPPGDTFSRMLGNDWSTLHWYRSEEERDSEFERMEVRHGYYRKTDTPTQILEKIVR